MLNVTCDLVGFKCPSLDTTVTSEVWCGLSGELSNLCKERPTSRSLGADQAPPDGVADQIGGLVYVELGHDPRSVRFRGLYADSEPDRDLLRSLTFGYEL